MLLHHFHRFYRAVAGLAGYFAYGNVLCMVEVSVVGQAVDAHPFDGALNFALVFVGKRCLDGSPLLVHRFFQAVHFGVLVFHVAGINIGNPLAIDFFDIGLAHFVVILHVLLFAGIPADGSVYFGDLGRAVLRPHIHSGMAVHTSIGSRNNGVLRAASAVVAILAVNFVQTSVRSVRELNGLLRRVALLTAQRHGVVHRCISAEYDECKDHKSYYAAARQDFYQGLPAGFLAFLQLRHVVEVGNDAGKHDGQNAQYQRRDEQLEGVVLLLGSNFYHRLIHIYRARAGIGKRTVDVRNDIRNFRVGEAGEGRHRHLLPLVIHFYGAGMACFDQSLRVANPTVEVFFREGCPAVF